MRSCRAPIASLDCMEEFNGGGGGGGGVDSGVHCSNTTGTKEQLLTSCIAAQAQRLQHPSPGIRYRNLGKSGLRVSNVGLGTLNVFPSYHVYRESSSAGSLSARSPNASCLRRRYIVSIDFPPPRFYRSVNISAAESIPGSASATRVSRDFYVARGIIRASPGMSDFKFSRFHYLFRDAPPLSRRHGFAADADTCNMYDTL